MRKTIYGVCPHDCPDTCGLITQVADGVATKVVGDPNHAVTQGWLCAKVRPYLDFVYHPDRLQLSATAGWPQRQRTVGAVLAGLRHWPKLANAGSRLSMMYGAEAILPYSYSGTLGLIQMKVAGARFWNRLGASQLARTICDAAAKMAVRATLRRTTCATIRRRQGQPTRHHLGAQSRSARHPTLCRSLKQAQRNGCEVIVIDPRRTRTAHGADLHIAPMPRHRRCAGPGHGPRDCGREGCTTKRGWRNIRWAGRNFAERVQSYPPDRVAEITGLSAITIVDLDRRYATIKSQPHQNTRRRAAQPEWWPNGARDLYPAGIGWSVWHLVAAGLSYNTGDYIQWDLDVVNKWDECPPYTPPPGRVVNMNRLGAALTGRSELIHPSNPSLSSGPTPPRLRSNAGKIVQGLRRDDLFTVVHELFMTDTAQVRRYCAACHLPIGASRSAQSGRSYRAQLQPPSH